MSLGLVANFDFGDGNPNIGTFESIGAGAGFNISTDVFAGFTLGSFKDLSKPTVNQNFVIGFFSFTTMWDIHTGDFVGATFGGFPVPDIGFSVTASKTFTQGFFESFNGTNSLCNIP